MNDQLFEDMGLPVDHGDVSLKDLTAKKARIVRQTKTRTALIDRAEGLTAWMGDGFPAPDETLHVILDGGADVWGFAEWAISKAGTADELWISTWIISDGIARRIVNLLDSGVIDEFHIVTALYFKIRAPHVYTYLMETLQSRGFGYAAFKNHAKVLLVKNEKADMWLTVQGSANLTKNPRSEQLVITNNQEVYEFHRSWMQSMVDK